MSTMQFKIHLKKILSLTGPYYGPLSDSKGLKETFLFSDQKGPLW